MTQDELAKQLGISKANLTRLLEIERKLTPEVKQLLDDGIITKTSASKIWVRLTEQEQLELLEELGKDKINEMTQIQVEQYIEALENAKLRSLCKHALIMRRLSITVGSASYNTSS